MDVDPNVSRFEAGPVGGFVSIDKCESGSSCFQPGEGPSRGLLRDYEPSDGTF